jgi:zinc protease
MLTNKKKGLYLTISFTILLFSSNIAEGNTLDNVKRTNLTNGLTVILREDHNLPLCSIQIWLKVGSVYEDNNYGISHFLEHLLFKGTKKYGVGEIAQIIESLGGRINAGTSKDFTILYFNVPKEGIETALEIATDVLQNTTFPSEEIERERLVILEEIKRQDDDPDSVLWNLFNEKMFSSIPYRQRIIGTTETISKISREDLLNYYQTYYVPNNASLIIVGDVETNKILLFIKEKFETLLKRELPSPPCLEETTQENFFFSEKKPVQQALLLSGFLGPTVENEDQYALDLLADILGEGRNSRLNKNLREEKELVFSIGSSYLTQKGSGLFIISARLEPEKINQVIDEIHQELLNLQKEGISDKELVRAKTLIENGWLFANETYSGQAHTLGYAVTLKNIEYAQEYLKNIAQVKKEDIKFVLDKYFQGKELSTIIFYPEK